MNQEKDPLLYSVIMVFSGFVDTMMGLPERPDIPRIAHKHPGYHNMVQDSKENGKPSDSGTFLEDGSDSGAF